MKILHIAYFDGQIGGVNAVVPQHVSEEAKYAETALLNVKDLSEEQRKAGAFSVGSDVADLIVFHEVYRPQFLPLYRAALKQGIPYVIIPHGALTQESQHKKRWKKTVANLLLFKRFIQKAKAIQCLSQNEFDHTKFSVEKFISTNGISVKRVKTEFHSSNIRFVYIGRLETEIKGIDLMLSAVKQRKKEWLQSGAVLDIYGPDDGYHEPIRSMIDTMELGDIVHLHSPVTGEEKTDILLGSDVFVQTSRTEGMSVGLLEAIATGLVIVATKGTGMTALIDRYGAGYTAECTADSIARAFCRALAETDTFPEKGRGALRLTEENFSWDRIAPACVNRYRELAGLKAETRTDREVAVQ